LNIWQEQSSAWIWWTASGFLIDAIMGRNCKTLTAGSIPAVASEMERSAEEVWQIAFVLLGLSDVNSGA